MKYSVDHFNNAVMDISSVFGKNKTSKKAGIHLTSLSPSKRKNRPMRFSSISKVIDACGLTFVEFAEKVDESIRCPK